MYDLIGDVHGHAAALERLLRQLGYRETRGAWRHPTRTAVFVGDYLDRGPEIPRAVRLVRAMVEAGSARAVLGNHEWNALAYHQRDPDAARGYLRARTAAHRRQHLATLEQFAGGAGRAELASHLAWFRQLPLWLDLGAVRVVHACWDAVAQQVVADGLARHGGVSDEFLVEGCNEESLLYAALDIVLKGKEMLLPPGITFTDKDGRVRAAARVRWYLDPQGHHLRSYALPSEGDLPVLPLPVKARAEARPYAAGLPPVFFGHYWLWAEAPSALAPNVACLDYSVAKGGFLCGYRFEGEGVLDDAAFVAIR
jgi:hypothetical protein